MTRKKERIKIDEKERRADAARLCFDFLWMEIEKNNSAAVGIVTMEQLKVFAQKIHESGFLSGVNFERFK